MLGYLGLGSNVGDREAHLRGAVESLREHGVSVESVSSLYETEPVGEITDQPDFLNAAVRVRTALEPVHCPECPHCRADALEREARQRDLQEQYARRHGMDDDDDRRIG